jgi:4-hydroxy-tetrahydrodipicolinate synthase
MDSLNLGAHGVISVAANVIPKSISKICTHIKENDKQAAEVLNKMNSNLYRLLFVESNPIPVKWMLQKMTKIQPGIRLPLVPLNECLHEMVTAEMLKLKLI